MTVVQSAGAARPKLYAASVLSSDPRIFYVRPRPKPFGLAGVIAERLHGAPATCIVRTMWSLVSPLHLRELVLAYREFGKAHPHLQLIIAANTQHEAALLSRRGVKAIVANHNIFVDERVFRPLPDVKPHYDAVYNANLSAFKRRELSAEIPSCAHICYPAESEHKKDFSTALAAARQDMPQHVFVNPDGPRGAMRLNPRQVNHALAQSHVGLCLSAVEGAMTSSMEYLMAGLPIVTTASLGGRSRYFSRHTAITVEPDPREVRDAVAALKTRNIPRSFVRKTTLKLVQKDRDAFNEFIGEMTNGRASGHDPRWRFRYVPNLYRWDSAEAFASELMLPDISHSK